jgi:DME family drug/metabolite transporter
MDRAGAGLAAERRGMSMVVAAASLWGTVGIAGQYLYNGSDISPITVGFYRLAVAAGIVLIAGLALTAAPVSMDPCVSLQQ